MVTFTFGKINCRNGISLIQSINNGVHTVLHRLQVLRLKPVLLTFPFHMEALPGNIFSMFPPLTTDQHRFLFYLTFTDLEAPPPHI